ncbi:Uncharacterised protein [Vibrio metschnikovii]|nr:hypothetical protein [Vibrio metschnikovii]EEX36484.1 hypothetical protein VIB_002799 [Vibrio metschnikovii CIP 69.14]SUP49439.1 Uncharacterised protein [Vibrio metschnikovii]SUQ10268.1 Uncharacterised protein [Vibrio metschnikovii]
MLDISKRIDVIKALLLEDTIESLTYAALEGRLTIELLCYERFKLSYSYLSEEDLKSWQPKQVVKQVSDDINEYITKGFSLSISNDKVDGRTPATKEEFESINYTSIGNQAELNINKLHKFWHAFSNVALHIPVPTIKSGDINIYGDKEKIKQKISLFIDYLSDYKSGNLLVGGSFGKVFSFTCCVCDVIIKKPVKVLTSPVVVNCINPECSESYLVEPDGNHKHIITRRIIKFRCQSCENYLEVPTNTFKELKFEQELNIRCLGCESNQTIVMRPQIKLS